MDKLTQIQASILIAVRSGHRYGYKIVAEVKDLLPSTAYKALSSLSERGLLTQKWERGTLGPDRVVYSLTAAGNLALKEWEKTIKEAMDVSSE